MDRVIFASADISERMKLFKQKKLEVHSFFPIDRGNCACAPLIKEWKDKLALMNPAHRDDAMKKVGALSCPRDKTGFTKYTITCKNCGQVQGYCYAKDDSLTDFFDFHYYQWTNGVQWKGCFTPNISPISEQLTIECCCGQDTRDFRANQTLSSKTVIRIEESNKRGRDFGKNDSKFAVAIYG